MDYNNGMKKTIRIVLNAFLAVMVIIQWVILATGIPDSSFMSGGLRTLRYFTVLSNLLEAAACIIWILTGNEKLKYVGAVSVGLTFTVVMVFLGPLFGYLMMFTGPSLWMHGIVPLAAMAEMIICALSGALTDSSQSCAPKPAIMVRAMFSRILSSTAI